MNKVNICFVCLLCALLLTVTGCSKKKVSVINASSGVVVHSSDFTGGFQKKVESKNQIKQVSEPTAKSSGRVINLGGGYEKIELSPLFDSI